MSRRIEMVAGLMLPSSVKLQAEALFAGGRPEFTMQEMGMACRGLKGREWDAFCFSYAGHHEPEKRLHEALVKAGRVAQRADGWPERLRRRACDCKRSANPDYVPDLATLVLISEAAPRLFANVHQKAAWFGISEKNWWRLLNRPYGTLLSIYAGWLGEAVSTIHRNLKGD